MLQKLNNRDYFCNILGFIFYGVSRAKTDLKLIPFYMAVVRRTMRAAIVSYLLKCFYFFSAAELNNIKSEDEVFAWEFSCEESDYGDRNDEDIEQLYIWHVK